jgi:hypothetical protein
VGDAFVFGNLPFAKKSDVAKASLFFTIQHRWPFSLARRNNWLV